MLFYRALVRDTIWPPEDPAKVEGAEEELIDPLPGKLKKAVVRSYTKQV